MAGAFEQVNGTDYEKTFAPVVSFSTLRLFLSNVPQEDLELHQMNVKTAYSYEDLEETVYMEQPKGFENKQSPSHVCKLLKALYGIKQAPRQWFSKKNYFFKTNLKMRNCEYDPCFYMLRGRGTVSLIVLYVDDILIAGSTMDVIASVKEELSNRFDMKRSGRSKNLPWS